MTLVEDAPAAKAAGLVGPAPYVASALRWSPALVATTLAGVLHLLWWRLLATPGGDIAAQDAWAAFAKAHPGSAYDLAWYGGMHPVSYSAVSPYLMAVLGVRPTMVVAGTLAAGLLAVLLERHLRHPMLPAVFGALALTGNAVSGRVTFGLGLVFGLAALVAVFAWPAAAEGRAAFRWLRIVVIVLLTALTTAASAVAGLFLGLVAAAMWLTGDRRLAYAIGLPSVVVVAVSAWLFPLSGVQPMHWSSAILPTAAALSAVLLFPREWRMLRALGLVYLVAVQLAWLVPSPVGTNISRLGLIFAVVGLVATLPGRDWMRSFAAGPRRPHRHGGHASAPPSSRRSPGRSASRRATPSTRRLPRRSASTSSRSSRRWAPAAPGWAGSRWCRPRATARRPPWRRTSTWPAAGTARPTPPATGSSTATSRSPPRPTSAG